MLEGVDSGDGCGNGRGSGCGGNRNFGRCAVRTKFGFFNETRPFLDRKVQQDQKLLARKLNIFFSWRLKKGFFSICFHGPENTGAATNQKTNQRTDIRGHREVSLPITVMVVFML